MLNKILRTIIGLPFVLFSWPFFVAGFIATSLLSWLVGYDCRNEMDKKTGRQVLWLPFEFMKMVWKE